MSDILECPKCHLETFKGDVFCRKCGYRFNSKEVSAESVEKLREELKEALEETHKSPPKSKSDGLMAFMVFMAMDLTLAYVLGKTDSHPRELILGSKEEGSV